MSKTASGLSAWAENAYGSGKYVYWYGTYCNPCTEARLKEKIKQYPAHYTDARMPTYKKHIQQGKSCTDCVGLIKGYYWENGGKVVYKRDGLPDTSAGGMYRDAKIKGSIGTIPEIPGVLVWTSNASHVGVYVGGGYVVEARSFSYGVQRNRLSARSFAYWGLCPYITYTAQEKETARMAASGTKTPSGAASENAGQIPAQGTETATAGKTEWKTIMISLNTLKNGSTGNQVRTVQRLLSAMGYDCGGVDGIFGSGTLAAAKAFQKAKGLTVDGIVGKNTWTALLK